LLKNPKKRRHRLHSLTAFIIGVYFPLKGKSIMCTFYFQNSKITQSHRGMSVYFMLILCAKTEIIIEKQ
jgi:hypothetical protein